MYLKRNDDALFSAEFRDRNALEDSIDTKVVMDGKRVYSAEKKYMQPSPEAALIVGK